MVNSRGLRKSGRGGTPQNYFFQIFFGALEQEARARGRSGRERVVRGISRAGRSGRSRCKFGTSVSRKTRRLARMAREAGQECLL